MFSSVLNVTVSANLAISGALEAVNAGRAVVGADIYAAAVMAPAAVWAWPSPLLRGMECFRNLLRRGPQLTIYGLRHDEAEATKNFVFEKIDEAHQNGAKKIGLEMTPDYYSGNYRANIFKIAAERAANLGMEVVLLETDEIGWHRRTVGNVLNFINDEGQIDREKIERAIQRVRAEVLDLSGNPYQPPEIQVDLNHFSATLRGYEEILQLLESLDWDMDRWGEEWMKWNRVQIEAKMRELLQKHRPEIVFVGGGHLSGLSDIRGYRFEDATDLNGAEELKYSHYTHLKEWSQMLKDKGVPKVAQSRIFEYLLKEVSGITGMDRENPKLLEVIDAALALEPDFWGWAMRMNRDGDPTLGVKWFRIPVAEARRRVESTAFSIYTPQSR